MTPNRDDSRSFWDEHYLRHPDAWSGEPNGVLVEETRALRPGSALDLGCGEGADAIWLAQRGWRVTAVDISAVALARGADRASLAGLAGQITWAQHDLDEDFPAGSFDLVAAHYLHSPQLRQRPRMLQHAVGAVAPGGILLLVGHSSIAPWSWDQDAQLPTAADVLGSVAPNDDAWTVAICEDRVRQAAGPNGETAVVTDSVVRLRRTR